MNAPTRFLLSLFLLCAVHAVASAQPWRTERTLLWEITGNGLTKPSYLFGTIHRRDAALYTLADSVLITLRSCDAFAGELDMDVAMRDFLMRYLVDDNGLNRLLRVARGDTSALSEGAESLSDTGRSGQPLVASEGAGNRQGAAPGDSAAVAAMPPADTVRRAPHSFEAPTPSRIDTITLADPSDSTGLPESISVRPSARWGILDEQGTDLFGSAEEVKPDDRPTIVDGYLYGVAKSLGKRTIGLETITEQIALHDGSSEPFSFFNAVRRSRRRNGRFRDAGEELVDVYSQRDLAKMYRLLQETTSPRMLKSVFIDRNHTMVERAEPYMREGSVFIAVGAGHLPGAQGMIELFIARGYTVRPVKATFAQYRLDSAGLPPSRAEWHTLVSSEGAFRVEMPAEPVAFPVDTGDVDSRMESHRYIWPDIGSGIMYSVGYADGTLPWGDAVGAGAIDGASYYESSSEDREQSEITQDGMPGLEVSWELPDKKMTRKRYYRRGARLYRLEVVGIPKQVQSADAERFFSSFQTLPFSESAWHTHAPEREGFSVEFPGVPRVAVDSQPTWLFTPRASYWAHDRATGRRAELDIVDLSPFYTADDSLDLYRDAIKTRLYSFDTSRPFRAVVQHGVAGAETDFKDDDGRYTQVMRLFLRGNRLYIQQFTMMGDTAGAGDAARFFASLRVGLPETTGDPFADKSGVLLDSLPAMERERRGGFDIAFRYHHFTREHLPRIRALLERKYADDDRYNGVRARLLEVLAKVPDSSSVSFIRTLYPSIAWHESLRDGAMDALVSIGSAEALHLLGVTILEESAKGEDVSGGIGSLELSVRTAAPVLPAMLELFDDTNNADAVYSLVATALDSGVLEPGTLAPFTETIIAYGRRALRPVPQDKAAAEDVDEEKAERERAMQVRQQTARLYRVAKVLGYLPRSPQTTELLSRMMAHSDEDVSFNAVCSSVRIGHTVPRRLIEKYAAHSYYRAQLFEVLQGKGMVAQMPERYRTQRSIAEGLLSQWLIDDEGEAPQEITCIGERRITEDGVEGRLYLYAFNFGGDEWYVGISGLQPLDEGAVNPRADLVYSSYDERDKRSIDQHVETLLRQWRATYGRK